MEVEKMRTKSILAVLVVVVVAIASVSARADFSNIKFDSGTISPDVAANNVHFEFSFTEVLDFVSKDSAGRPHHTFSVDTFTDMATGGVWDPGHMHIDSFPSDDVLRWWSYSPTMPSPLYEGPVPYNPPFVYDGKDVSFDVRLDFLDMNSDGSFWAAVTAYSHGGTTDYIGRFFVGGVPTGLSIPTPVTPVPLPGAVLLGIVGFGWVARTLRRDRRLYM
jgi:hypothetical protein